MVPTEHHYSTWLILICLLTSDQRWITPHIAAHLSLIQKQCSILQRTAISRRHFIAINILILVQHEAVFIENLIHGARTSNFAHLLQLMIFPLISLLLQRLLHLLLKILVLVAAAIDTRRSLRYGYLPESWLFLFDRVFDFFREFGKLRGQKFATSYRESIKCTQKVVIAFCISLFSIMLFPTVFAA